MPTSPNASVSFWKIGLAGAAIASAGLVSYHNSFSGPFVFDDIHAIIENPTIRPPWEVGRLLSPPVDITVGGRPILNLSLAFNYAIGGERVWGYHALNLIIHILAGLTLFGVARRTLRRRSALDPTTPAFCIALLWVVHPLQTESVTYIIQRAESLMGLFYLLTLYCFIRGVPPSFAGASEVVSLREEERQKAAESGSRRWLALSWLACLLGMATKEVMVSAPVMVLLYDRTFAAGSFAAAWRKRKRYYLCLAATWVPLACLVAGAGGNRGGTTGIESGTTFTAYALTQFPAIADYLWLAVWPHPLVFDYGTEWVNDAGDVLLPALLVLVLVAGTACALKRRPAIGFLGAWFFAVLAPTSLIPGARQTMAEHRMYLALVPVVALLVIGLFRGIKRHAPAACLALAIAWIGLTASRNQDYRSVFSIWSDTVAKQPSNPWAQTSLGMALLDGGKPADALPHLEQALRLKPGFGGALNDLGLALAASGRLTEAVDRYEEAIRLYPRFAEAHNNLGTALCGMGRPDDGLVHLETALALNPELPMVRFNLGNALAQLGRMDEAIARYRESVQLHPDYAPSHLNLGNALYLTGHVADAIAEYRTVLSLDPQNGAASDNLQRLLQSR